MLCPGIQGPKRPDGTPGAMGKMGSAGDQGAAELLDHRVHRNSRNTRVWRQDMPRNLQKDVFRFLPFVELLQEVRNTSQEISYTKYTRDYSN